MVTCSPFWNVYSSTFNEAQWHLVHNCVWENSITCPHTYHCAVSLRTIFYQSTPANCLSLTQEDERASTHGLVSHSCDDTGLDANSIPLSWATVQWCCVCLIHGALPSGGRYNQSIHVCVREGTPPQHLSFRENVPWLILWANSLLYF